ncbi:MAG: hypothetical protein FJ299_12030 [Planctomycetes bacterium]|nr:hypothetical protein [Planctomycetota bacterium]
MSTPRTSRLPTLVLAVLALLCFSLATAQTVSVGEQSGQDPLGRAPAGTVGCAADPAGTRDRASAAPRLSPLRDPRTL